MTDAPPPELADALARFERGDFAGARAEAQRRAGESDAGVAAAARALLLRLAPDPWAVRFGLLVLAALALVSGLYVGR